jgi:hypothetical protein
MFAAFHMGLPLVWVEAAVVIVEWLVYVAYFEARAINSIFQLLVLSLLANAFSVATTMVVL